MSQIRTNSIVPAGGLAGDGGGIIQVVSSTVTTSVYNTSASMNDIAGMSVSITPSSTSSKILVIVNAHFCGSSGSVVFWNLVRNSTNIAVSTQSGMQNNTTGYLYNATTYNEYSLTAQDITHLDSPSTTSATTYKCQWRSSSAGNGIYLNRRDGDTYASVVSSITAMEVSG